MASYLAYGLLSTPCEFAGRMEPKGMKMGMFYQASPISCKHTLRCQDEILTVVVNKVFCFLLLWASSEAVNGSGLSTARETWEPLRDVGGFTSLSCSFEVYFCHAFRLRSLKSHSFTLWQLHSPVAMLPWTSETIAQRVPRNVLAHCNGLWSLGKAESGLQPLPCKWLVFHHLCWWAVRGC